LCDDISKEVSTWCLDKKLKGEEVATPLITLVAFSAQLSSVEMLMAGAGKNSRTYTLSHVIKITGSPHFQ